MEDDAYNLKFESHPRVVDRVKTIKSELKNIDTKVLKIVKKLKNFSIKHHNKEGLPQLTEAYHHKEYDNVRNKYSITFTIEHLNYTDSEVEIHNINEDIDYLLTEFAKIVEIFITMLASEIYGIELMVLNIKPIEIMAETKLFLFPFQESYINHLKFNLNHLTSIKYYSLLKPSLENISSYNLSKLIVCGLAARFLEIITRSHYEDLITQEIIDQRLSGLDYGVRSLFQNALNQNENLRYNLEQFHEVLKNKSKIFPSLCSQCHINPKEEIKFCEKNLCRSCFDRKEFCKDCSHTFILLESPNPQEITEPPTCVCGEKYVVDHDKKYCQCGIFCKFCNHPQHDNSCFQKIKWPNVEVCPKMHIGCKKKAGSITFFCQNCTLWYCLACKNPDNSDSHLTCLENLKTSKIKEQIKII